MTLQRSFQVAKEFTENKGIFQEAQDILIESSINNEYVMPLSSLVRYVKFLRAHEFDAHITIQGQNGVGKSMAALYFCQKLGSLDINNVIFPFHSHEYLIERLIRTQNANIWIDELGHFFPYKLSMSTEQNSLFSAIEISRANKNLVLGCCRDITRINNNYRNGKAAVVVWLLDRYKNPPMTESAILIGNPFFETEDKFYLSTLQPHHDYNIMRKQIESLPSFAGYMFFDNIMKQIKKPILQAYKKKKMEGITYVGEYQQTRISQKKARLEKNEGAGQSYLDEFE